MAFADPISVPTTAPLSLPRVMSDGMTSEYSDGDRKFILQIKHQQVRSGDWRTVISLSSRKIALDPLTANNKEVKHLWQFVVQRKAGEFTNTELIDTFKGLSGLLSASTNAGLTKLLGLES